MIDFPEHHTRHSIARPAGVLEADVGCYAPRNDKPTTGSFRTIESRKAWRGTVLGVEYKTGNGWNWVPSETKGFRLRDIKGVVCRGQGRVPGGYLVRVECKTCDVRQPAPVAVSAYRAARKEMCMTCFRKRKKFGDVRTAENW